MGKSCSCWCKLFKLRWNKDETSEQVSQTDGNCCFWATLKHASSIICILLSEESKEKLARKFNISYRYIDELISFNNERFKKFIPNIYPKDITISETTESTSVATYLDLLFTKDENNNITTKLYDKRDAFGFHIVKFSSCQAIFHQHQHTVSMHLSSSL